MKKIKISLVLALLLAGQLFAVEISSGTAMDVSTNSTPSIIENIKALFTPAPKEEKNEALEWICFPDRGVTDIGSRAGFRYRQF